LGEVEVKNALTWVGLFNRLGKFLESGFGKESTRNRGIYSEDSGDRN
jgi:hypothetical protein